MPHGAALQVDPIRLTLKAPGTKRLKLICDELLSSLAFNLNLRRYIMFSLLTRHTQGATLPFIQYVGTMAAVEAIQEAADEALANSQVPGGWRWGCTLLPLSSFPYTDSLTLVPLHLFPYTCSLTDLP